jgi:hypothetical protein
VPSAASSSAGSSSMRSGCPCLLPYPRRGGFTMVLIQLFQLTVPAPGNGGRSGCEPPYPPSKSPVRATGRPRIGARPRTSGAPG